jgi:hypothetical protein
MGAGEAMLGQQEAPVTDEGFCFLPLFSLSSSRRKHYSGSTNMGCQ